MTAIEIKCRPSNGILRLSANTVSALDDIAESLAMTLPAGTPWQVDVLVGSTPADTLHLTATPATPDEPKEAAA